VSAAPLSRAEAELAEVIRDAFFHQGHTLTYVASVLGISVDRARRLRDWAENAS
jgi:DNA-directed RNA polymerase specialized sigma subunit